MKFAFCSPQLRCASVLALVCLASAAKLEGYSDGGDTGLGVALDDGELLEEGVGGGSVLPLVLVGSGVLPESAIVGVTVDVSGDAAGDAIGAGNLPDGDNGEGYIPPSVVPEVAPVDVAPAPGGEYLAPHN